MSEPPPLTRPKPSRLHPLPGQAPFTHRSLQGRGAMPPAAWQQAGSTLLTAAPDLAHRRRPLPPSPRGAMPAEYMEHAERLRGVEEAEARRKATLAATTLNPNPNPNHNPNPNPNPNPKPNP